MKNMLAILLILLIAIPTSLILAQDEPETRPVDLPNGHTIDLPVDWELAAQNEEEPTKDDMYRFTQGEAVYLLVILPAATEPYYADLDMMPTPAELLVLLAENDVIEPDIVADEIAEMSAEAGDTQTGDAEGTDTTVAGAENAQPENSARFAFDDEDGQGIASVSAWDAGLAYIEFYAPADEFDTIEETVAYIVEQLEDMAAGDCMVSTDKKYGVPLRVGPGFNRGEYTSLLAEDGEVLVLDKFIANDGTLWWRVEENYDAVNALWVLAADVIASGNCDALTDATMPAPSISGDSAGVEGAATPPVPGGDFEGELPPDINPGDIIVITVEVHPGGSD